MTLTMPPCLVLTLARILTSLCPNPTNPTQTFQKIHGFGGALTQSSATVYKQLPEELQAAVIEAYYGPTGIGYTTGRMPIHSCDFSVDTYTFDDVAGDYDLEKFDTTVAYDQNLSLPMIHAAIAVNPSLRLFGSPWSPPAWMKDNNDMLWGGSLLDEAKESWAQVIERRTTYGLSPAFVLRQAVPRFLRTPTLAPRHSLLDTC
jgi:glucosylceramidase